jgi:hypothetical protein
MNPNKALDLLQKTLELTDPLCYMTKYKIVNIPIYPYELVDETRSLDEIMEFTNKWIKDHPDEVDVIQVNQFIEIDGEQYRYGYGIKTNSLVLGIDKVEDKKQ